MTIINESSCWVCKSIIYSLSLFLVYLKQSVDNGYVNKSCKNEKILLKDNKVYFVL